MLFVFFLDFCVNPIEGPFGKLIISRDGKLSVISFDVVNLLCVLVVFLSSSLLFVVSCVSFMAIEFFCCCLKKLEWRQPEKYTRKYRIEYGKGKPVAQNSIMMMDLRVIIRLC